MNNTGGCVQKPAANAKPKPRSPSGIRTLAAPAAKTQAPRADRRVHRTRRALRDALLALLPEVGWDHIDVAKLCERADIGRSTFYLHYTDKTALLRGAFSDLQEHLLSHLDTRSEAASPFPFLPGLLNHVHEQQEVFRALLGRRSSHAVQAHFQDLLVSLFSLPKPPRGSRKAPLANARADMLAGSLFHLLVWWLGSARPHSPSEVEAMFLAFSVCDAQATAPSA